MSLNTDEWRAQLAEEQDQRLDAESKYVSMLESATRGILDGYRMLNLRYGSLALHKATLEVRCAELEAAQANAVQKERDFIAVWLRTWFQHNKGNSSSREFCDRLATIVERGEHHDPCWWENE